MALVVESGSGAANSESYVSVADATAYHEARGNVAWLHIETEVERERVLRQATDHMLRVFRGRWLGDRVRPAQALDWPRYGVCIDGFPVPYNGVPVEVAHACAELAIRAVGKPLAPDLGPQKLRTKVDTLEVEYAPYTRQQVKFQVVDDILRPFLRGGSGALKVVRT